MTTENQQEKVNNTRKIATFFRRVFMVVGFFAAIFTTGLAIYEPSVQSTVMNIDIPAPIINPEIDIVSSYQMKRNSKLPEEVAKLQATLIVDKSVQHKLPTSLVVAIIETESLFDPLSESSVGARGLMQVYQSAKVDIDDSQIFNLGYNLQKGCEILAEKLDKANGDLPKALAAYSGNAKGYTDKIYTGVGRYEMFKRRNM